MSEFDVLVAGETLIDFLPDRPGSLDRVETFTRRPGGAPANVAVGLAALDAVPWFWTRVGSDPFGDLLVRILDGHGLPDRFVERDPEAKTTLAFVSHDEDADRAFTFYRDGTADTRMQPGRIGSEVLERVSWVHLGGVTLASEPAREATIDLATRAHGRGCTVSFDPNARPELWSDREEFATLVDRFLTNVDVLKATPEDLDEADIGIDADGPVALARAVCERGPHTTLLTLGEEGAVAVATEDSPWSGEASHPGYAVDPVDTTGAGDAFTAGAIAALSGGEDLEAALGFANAVAATTTTAEGAMTALPGREAVARFRDETPVAGNG
jgi:fructokinase